MSQFFDISVADAEKELNTSVQNGLSDAEAQARLAQNGPNRLEGQKERSLIQMFLAQFKDFLVIILIIAAVISLFLHEYVDGGVILLIVVLNAVLGASEENKASNALKALKRMSSPLAKIIRNGAITKINSEEVTPGDLVVLEAGDYVPADLRLVESVNLKIDESALTGESVPVEKNAGLVLETDAVLGDRVNCGYMGTVVTYGRGKGIVTGTGMSTQMGSIAAMLNETQDESTPLQKKLDSMGKMLGIVCIAICAVIFGLGVLKQMDIFEIFMTSVSLAVAAIPEGLTVVVTVVLAMGMQRMVKSNAIMKRLSAVETLGSTTVICSDKTGTLTQNKMMVVKAYDNSRLYQVSGTGYGASGEITAEDGSPASPFGDPLKTLLTGAVLCNDSIYEPEKEQIIGDPTEGALLVAGEKIGLTRAGVNEAYPRVDEIPFDSDRKLMSTLHKTGEGYRMYTKGAPDETLKRCSHILRNGAAVPLTAEDRAGIAAVNDQFANEALRVLAVAYQTMETPELSPESENNLIFAGLVCMIDPPRAEAREAVATCKQAGIAVKMITGDHKITARAIARDIGIIENEGNAIDGSEISALTDEALRETVKTTSVFARVSPEHKVRLVSAIRANGNITAMTGDGVNDAPSLKRADIGIAMGITGTDVAKEAADMILTDDNFASIVHAVEEGRTIYNNIRKVVAYLLSCNIGEILLILVAMLLGYPVPLAPIQLLSVNLITDAFPAFALGMEAKEAGIMKIPPRDPSQPIVDKTMWGMVIFRSIGLTLAVLGSYILMLYMGEGEAVAMSVCYFTLVAGELIKAYSSRSESTPIYKMPLLTNAFLNKSVLFSLAFLLLTIYVPFMNVIFKTVPLRPLDLAIALAFSLLPALGGELSKLIFQRKR